MPVIGVGTDVAEVARFARLLDRGGRRFLDRWFRPSEVEWLLSRTAPARHTASLFAAKEAVLKALGVPDVGPVQWRDIEILSGPAGRTEVFLHGGVRELAQEAGVRDFHAAFSQMGRVAVATVLAVSDPPAQPVL